ncbi:MAG: hypothetical protein RLZZ217_641 [Planctomycetota bacterium]
MAQMTDVKIPSPGESITEVRLGQWKRGDGDWVEKDELLNEIESDKATLELLAPAAGVLRVKADSGSDQKVGAAVAQIDTAAAKPAGGGGGVRPMGTAAAEAAKSAATDTGQKATPTARKMAEEHGISLAGVQGSGPAGRVTRADVEGAIAEGPDRLLVVFLRKDLAFLQVGLARRRHHVGLAIQNLFQILQGYIEKVPDAAGEALQEPDVGHGGGQLDMAQTLATNLGLDDFHTALLAGDPAVLHALVLAAQALVVLHGSEDLGTKEAILLRLEGTVIDGLRLLYFAVRPTTDLLRGGKRNAHRHILQRILGLLEKIVDVLHGELRRRSMSFGIRNPGRGHLCPPEGQHPTPTTGVPSATR